MVQYKVVGVLGSVVAIVDSIDAVVSTVQGQHPISDKKQRTLRNKLGKAKPGAMVWTDYAGSGCDVYVISTEAN